VKVRATDDSGNIGAASARNVTVFYTTTSSTSLVAAYDFNAGSGTTLSDLSGHGNNGTIANGTWSNSGRYGKALSFNGTSSLVTVADSNSLDLTTGMTLEAWVKPTSFNGWESVLMKERTGGLVYSMYAADDTLNAPIGYVRTASGDNSAQRNTSLPLNQWSHLASTFDGSTLRLYVNGIEVVNQSATGSMAASTGALRIGGDSVFGGEFFEGLIDDIRVYNRALSNGEIASDLSTPIGGALDNVAPTVAVTSPGGGAVLSGTTALTASASDNAAVAAVQFLIDGNPIGNEVRADTGVPFVLNWNTAGIGNGAHTLSARARDVAGTVTTSSSVNVTISNPADTTPPVVSVTSPTQGESIFGSAVLNATAFDNTGVTGVQFLVNGTNLGSQLTGAPFRIPWNTASLASGQYVITALAQDAAGNTATSPGITVSIDNSAPSVISQSPSPGATQIATSATVSAGFSKPVQSSSVAMTLTDSLNHAIPGQVSYFGPTNTVTFIPDKTLAPSSSFTVTVSGALDNAGRPMAAPVTWSFSTSSQVQDATVFRNQTPAIVSVNDANAVELGMRFSSELPGTITGIRFYKGPNNVGTHVGHLWTASGTLLASVTFSGEVGLGWQTALFSSAVQINADTIYVVSYYAPNGQYSATNTTFATSGIDNSPLHAPANDSSNPNGIYVYHAGGGFPTTSGAGSNYFVDVLFTSEQDTTAPTVTARTPAPGATSISTVTSVTARFSEPVQESTISFVLKDAAQNIVPAVVTYSPTSHTATLTPSDPLSPLAVYRVVVSGARDIAGNVMTGTDTWTFTTAANSSFSLWRDTTTPNVPSANDTAAIELGLKFQSDVSGSVTAIRFYKGAGNTGAHVGHLWSASGQLLASVTFSNESASGWQEALLSQPLAISAGTTYVVSYVAPNGHYAADGAYFAGGSTDVGPLHALASGASGGNGVYLYGGGFPTNTYNATNYWVDLLFLADQSDTTPPTVASTNPASGATGVATNATVKVTFSESIQPATLSFNLTGPGNTQVQATWTYDDSTRTATLTPGSALANSTVYAATVSGAKDLAGNAMASATSWSFTTASSTLSNGTTIWANTTIPATPSTNDGNALEVGLKFRSSATGLISGVRFYKGTGNAGTHVGHLWNSSGTLLGTVTFSNETASGWQQADFATPIAIAPNTSYVISYYAPTGHYASNSAYFASSATTNGALTALDNTSSGGNGVYRYGAGGGFPASSYNATNYWVDVVFSANSDTTPPTITSTSPPDQGTGINTSSDVTATFSEPVQANTISLVLKDAQNNVVPSSVSYDATTNTATLHPTGALAPSTRYTVSANGAKDLAGNTMSPVTWSFTTAYSLWTNAVTPAIPSVNDSNAIELGVKFRLDVDGSITGIRFYKGPGNTGTHVGHLWDSAGNLLGSVTFSSETAGGWQQAAFSTPVAVSANTTYVVSYYAPSGGYSASGAYFANSGTDVGPLHALSNAAGNGNGVYRYGGGGGGFPTNSYNATNYWVDVAFAVAADTTPPTITARNPAPGATGVAANTSVTATFSEMIVSSTLSMVLKDPNGTTVAASLSYDANSNTATLAPSAALSPLTAYTVTVSGAKDLAGNTMASTSWSFTTEATTYSVWDDSATPATTSVNDGNAIEVGVKFRVDVSGSITGIRFYKGAGNTGTHLGHLWDSAGNLLATVSFSNESASGWQQAQFSTPVHVNAGATYTVSYYAPSGHYSATGAYFASTGAGSGPVHALASGVDGQNGVYRYGAGGGFPTGSFNSTNYWVDVLFVPDSPGATSPGAGTGSRRHA
jgi:methionine-rich copper-binding protein CopC